MDLSAYLIPNPWALIAATKDYSLTGMFPHKTFWKLGGIRIPSATSTLKQIYTCALNAVRACMGRGMQESALMGLILQAWMPTYLNGQGESMLVTCPVKSSTGIKNGLVE